MNVVGLKFYLDITRDAIIKKIMRKFLFLAEKYVNLLLWKRYLGYELMMQITFNDTTLYKILPKYLVICRFFCF